MRATQHISNNCVLTGGPGVAPLPVTQIIYPDETPGVVSYWQPTAQELAALAEGKPVKLLFIGNTHPPVYVGVEGVE